jgi:hypothetical protein
MASRPPADAPIAATGTREASSISTSAPAAGSLEAGDAGDEDTLVVVFRGFRGGLGSFGPGDVLAIELPSLMVSPGESLRLRTGAAEHAANVCGDAGCTAL